MMKGKPCVASMANAPRHCSRDNPARLTYTVSGNVAICLKTDTRGQFTSIGIMWNSNLSGDNYQFQLYNVQLTLV